MGRPGPEVPSMPHADEPTAPSPDANASTKPRRRIPPFVLVGVLGVIVIGALVWREVAAIRAAERETDRQMAELDREEAEEGAYHWDVEWPGDEVVVRLTEVQRQGPETGGRYHLDVGPTRWALDVPPVDADEETWARWEETTQPSWTALALALRELAEEGRAAVRAEIFSPWRDAQDDVPQRLLLRLLPILAAAGILDLDVVHAPPALLDAK